MWSGFLFIGEEWPTPYSWSVIYLDNNATTMPLAEVVDAMRESLANNWGNPSSVHRFGQAARAQLEHAREHVAQLVGCSARELIFCSSGTESASLALRGVLEAHPKRRVIVTSKLEHAAVRTLAQHLEAAGQCEVIWVEHAHGGEIHLDHLREALKKHADDIALVSLMSVNNETGVILPLQVVGELCREKNVLFHTDATQSLGRHAFDVANAPVDFATFSAHKLHGPKGAAALFARRGAGISAQLVGGPQERDRRAGTENVPGIIGFGVAALAARAWFNTADMNQAPELRNELEHLILAAIPDAIVNGVGTKRIWNTTNIAFAHLEAEAILLALSNENVCASAGAACSSGSLDPSPVLLAMGVPPVLAHGSVRFSLSRFTTREEVAQAATIVCDCVRKLRARTGAAITNVK